MLGDMAWYIPILIFFARICDVSIGTVRTILVIGNHAIPSAVLGFFEVIIWALAVGGVIAYLTNPFALAGYAGGFAVGVLVGMTIENRVALGYRIIRAISTDLTINLSAQLRELGYRVTSVNGHGMSGPVEMAFMIVRRRDLNTLRNTIATIDPKCYISVSHAERPTEVGHGIDSRFGRLPWMRSNGVRK